MPTKMRVLITVKTYPLPSTTPLMEVVCTAGVLEDGSFVRLFPIDFRYRPYAEWFKKYQWIEVIAEKNKRDKRPESYIPLVDEEIKVVSEVLPTRNRWAERKQYVLARELRSMCFLNAQPLFAQSLAVIRPREVTGMTVTEVDPEWKSDWRALFEQQRLFGPQQKPLEKIPYEFSYTFLCDDPQCSGHEMMIADWELAQLYRAMRDRHGGERAAVEKVREKYLSQMCSSKIDTHLFVGTTLAHPKSWIVLGVFWPKK